MTELMLAVRRKEDASGGRSAVATAAKHSRRMTHRTGDGGIAHHYRRHIHWRPDGPTSPGVINDWCQIPGDRHRERPSDNAKRALLLLPTSWPLPSRYRLQRSPATVLTTNYAAVQPSYTRGRQQLHPTADATAVTTHYAPFDSHAIRMQTSRERANRTVERWARIQSTRQLIVCLRKCAPTANISTTGTPHVTCSVYELFPVHDTNDAPSAHASKRATIRRGWNARGA